MFIRCQDPKTITAMNSYEVNIFDKRPDQSYRTGGIVDVAKPASDGQDRWQVEHLRHHRAGLEADGHAERHEDGGRRDTKARSRTDCASVRCGDGEVPQRAHQNLVDWL